MIRLLFSLFLISLGSSVAAAQCDGTDLINTLSDQERAVLNARVAETPYPTGLLWRAKRGATQITLFGTYHFPHERTEAHLEALKPLIDQADVVYLEVSTADQKALQVEMALDPSIMFITQGQTLPELLNDADWTRLSSELDKRGIPGFMAAKFKPFWAAMMLGIGPCEARNSLSSHDGIDARIGAYATEIGVPNKSLEDFRTILTLFDGFSQEEQLDMIRLLFAWDGDPDDMAYTLRQKYLAQNIGLLWEFSRQISLQFGGPNAAADFALMESQLLIRRNNDWMDVLRTTPDDQEIFIAVGAAHLPGEHGVLRLLEKDGYEIVPLPFR